MNLFDDKFFAIGKENFKLCIKRGTKIRGVFETSSIRKHIESSESFEKAFIEKASLCCRQIFIEERSRSAERFF